jgi:hypothetical protein
VQSTTNTSTFSPASFVTGGYPGIPTLFPGGTQSYYLTPEAASSYTMSFTYSAGVIPTWGQFAFEFLPASAAVTISGANWGTTNASAATITATIFSTTAGNFLVCYVAWRGSATLQSVVLSTGSTAFTQQGTTQVVGTSQLAVFTCVVPSSATNPTVKATFSNSPGTNQAALFGIQIAGSAGLVATIGQTTGTVSPASITTSGAPSNGITFGVVVQDSTTNSFTGPTGWTAVGGSGNLDAIAAYKIGQYTNAAQTANWTFTPNAPWARTYVTVAAAPLGSGAPTVQLMQR